MLNRFRQLSVFLTASILGGCMLEAGEEFDEELQDTPFAVERDAIGELRCATTNITDFFNNGEVVSMGGWPSEGILTATSTSPDADYDPEGCPQQYITEIRNVYGRSYGFEVGWVDGPLDETSCGAAHMTLSAYGESRFFWHGRMIYVWTKIGETQLHGTWVSMPTLSHCSWEYDAGYESIPVVENGTYLRVRTAAQASSYTTIQRVYSGLWYGPGM